MQEDTFGRSIRQKSKLLISEISSAIWLIRAPLFAALVAAFVFHIDQMREIFFLFSEEISLQMFFFSSLFLLFCLLLWQICHDLLAVAHYQSDFISRRAFILRRILPVFVALIPIIGLYQGVKATSAEFANLPVKSQLAEGGTAEASNDQIAEASRRGLNISDLGGFRPAHAILRAELNGKLRNLSKLDSNLRTAASALLALAVFLLAAGCFHAVYGRPNAILDGDKGLVIPRCLHRTWLWISTFVVFLTLFALQGQGWLGPWGDLAAVPIWLGTLAVILLFLIYLTIFLSLMTRLYDKLEIPAISLFFIAAFLASYLDWNNNHAVQLVNRGADASNPPPLSALFAGWVKALPGRDKPDGYVRRYVRQKGDYPVFLFAVQGGGQYASILAAVTLAKLFDRCPALRHHVFAVSGVSGGSVGAGMFVAQLKTELSDPASVLNSNRCEFDLANIGSSQEVTSAAGPLESKINTLLQNDFLAPLVARGLFPDFLQRFLPWPSVPAFDRARAFESGLEYAWRKTNPGKPSPLEADFLSHWSPSGGIPMLLLNTTRVQTGEPVLIAPFLTRRPVPNAAELRTIYSVAAEAPHSIRLSTAMGLSARFPVVMPVGRLHADPASSFFDLVDGGYFENSGAETIRVLHEELSFYRNYPNLLDPSGELEAILKMMPIRFKAIVLNELDPIDTSKGQTLNELSSPVEALYRARRERGEMAINRLFSSLDTGIIRISHDPFPLPLGWRLSLSKQDFISSIVGTPDECDDARPAEILRAAELVAKQYQDELKKFSVLDDQKRRATGKRIGNLYYLMHRNRCVLRDIVRDVRTSS
jgi:hypothetical protein